MPDRLKRDSILTLTICSVGIEKIYKHDVQIVEQTFRFGSDGSIPPGSSGAFLSDITPSFPSLCMNTCLSNN